MKNRPQGLAEWDSGRLHSTAIHLRQVMWEDGWSAKQERLWERLVRELEYRHRRPAQFGKQCWCPLCRGPFPTEPCFSSGDGGRSSADDGEAA